MKKRRILLAALAAITLAPVALPFGSQSASAIQEAGQVQGKELLALGRTLNAQQAQETIQLLGASNVTADNTIYVDGVMIDRYLHIGSDMSTGVYSSVYIKEQAPGTGIQVQIVTPQNITDVSATTYQNAAITAGAKNALLRIGTVLPVTGEGALTGLYALLESQGVKVSEHDVNTAQKEITVVSNVKTDTGMTDNQVNVIISEIKKEVAKQVQENGQKQVNSTEIVNNVVNNVINNSNTNIVGDDNVVDNSVSNEANISNEIKQELEQYADDFANTQAASNVDTVQQLDVSIEDRPWKEILAELSPAMTVEEIKAMGEPDFSDAEKYHPIIPEMYKAFMDKVNQGIRIDDLYAQTFIVEKVQPSLTTESKAAFDELRELMYQYTASFEHELKADAEAQGYEFKAIKDQWLEKLQVVEDRRNNDPELAEIIQLIANATGYAPEVYTYTEIEQEGSVISLSVAEDSAIKQTVFARFQYNLENGEISEINIATMEAEPLAQDTFNFEQVYGVAVENMYQAGIIPADYTIPGYVPEEETTEEETTEEETTEENLPADMTDDSIDPTEMEIIEEDPEAGQDPIEEPTLEGEEVDPNAPVEEELEVVNPA